VSHCGLAIYIEKVSKYFRQKKKNFMETSNISPCKNIIFKKYPPKENQKSFKIVL